MYYSNLKYTSTKFFFKLRGLMMKSRNDTMKWAKDKDIYEIFANTPSALESFRWLSWKISDNKVVET
jgi:hypothetical protein